MIYLLGGDIGSGKTLKVLPWMADAIKAGRFVASNIELTDACPFGNKVALIDTPQYPVARDDDEQKIARKSARPDADLPFNYFWEYLPPDALVVIDEGDIYFDSSEFGTMKKACRIYHKQLRKFGHDIVYIVQRYSNLYKRIRDLAGRYIYAEHNYRTNRIFKLIEKHFGQERALGMSRFFYWEFSSQDLNPRSCRGEGYFSYAEAKRFFGWYSTTQLLGDTLKLLRPGASVATNAVELPPSTGDVLAYEQELIHVALNGGGDASA